MTLTRNAASLLNRDRIRVNQINVGWTLTEGERRVKREQEGKGDEWIAEAIATRPPTSRQTRASASPEASSISSSTRPAP